mmetsp:Transcript_66983/g.151376  ORF Transcript_66983/g.151376 Transcript_66983/m.151376 type:complete len:204 (-) Transcript_66983:606-1217(-)
MPKAPRTPDMTVLPRLPGLGWPSAPESVKTKGSSSSCAETFEATRVQLGSDPASDSKPGLPGGSSTPPITLPKASTASAVEAASADPFNWSASAFDCSKLLAIESPSSREPPSSEGSSSSSSTSSSSCKLPSLSALSKSTDDALDSLDRLDFFLVDLSALSSLLSSVGGGSEAHNEYRRGRVYGSNSMLLISLTRESRSSAAP